MCKRAGSGQAACWGEAKLRLPGAMFLRLQCGCQCTEPILTAPAETLPLLSAAFPPIPPSVQGLAFSVCVVMGGLLAVTDLLKAYFVTLQFSVTIMWSSARSPGCNTNVSQELYLPDRRVLGIQL